MVINILHFFCMQSLCFWYLFSFNLQPFLSDVGNISYFRHVLLHCHQMDSVFRILHYLQRFVDENLEVRSSSKLNSTIQTSKCTFKHTACSNSFIQSGLSEQINRIIWSVLVIFFLDVLCKMKDLLQNKTIIRNCAFLFDMLCKNYNIYKKMKRFKEMKK